MGVMWVRWVWRATVVFTHVSDVSRGGLLLNVPCVCMYGGWARRVYLARELVGPVVPLAVVAVEERGGEGVPPVERRPLDHRLDRRERHVDDARLGLVLIPLRQESAVISGHQR